MHCCLNRKNGTQYFLLQVSTLGPLNIQDNILPPCDTISVSVSIVLHWLLWHYCLFFISIGRAAATRSLDLSRAGVRVDDNGKVVVDQEERTSTPNVYAIGDVAKVLLHACTYDIRT